MKVRFYNIGWDTSDDGFDDDIELDLPTEVTVVLADDEVDDDTDLEFEGADILSDIVGFCVDDFEYEILEQD